MAINAAIKKSARERDNPRELRAKLDLDALNSARLEVLSWRGGAINLTKALSPEEAGIALGMRLFEFLAKCLCVRALISACDHS